MKPRSPAAISKKASIFIVEDHPIFRDGITQLINKEPDMLVCGEAESAPEALDMIKKGLPDLIIVDITLKGSCGIELTRELHKKYANIPVLKAGARGYLTKQETTATVITAIRKILRGRLYISETMTEHFLNRYIRGDATAGESPVDSLSEREFEVFNLIGRGLTNKTIADMLCVSSKTISTYRERIKEKLNLRNNAELSRYAMFWLQNSSKPE